MVRCALLLVATISAAALAAAPAGAEIRIGVAGPMTGTLAWYGEQFERGAELAVEDLNSAGGVLGQQVRLLTADDSCDPEQAVAAANKLVSDGVIFVAGHFCSGASIPASEIYEAAGILQISPASTNPLLTELGRSNVFRVTHRDDATGAVAGNYLADNWPDEKIAILHDNSVFGKDSADLSKEQLNRRGVTEALYRSYVPGKTNYGVEIAELQEADVAVAFIGGYDAEIALMARAAHDRGYPVQLMTATSLSSEHFGLIAGAGAEGVLFLDVADVRERTEAAPVVERFRASRFEPEGLTLNAYAAVQVWAQAVEKAGSLELEAMIAALRDHEFDTVLGPLDFDEKGDRTVQNPVWYIWRGDTYLPLDDAPAAGK